MFIKLRVKVLDVEVGKYKVILNEADAKEMGLRTGDRVRIRDESTFTAVVETTETFVASGQVGIYADLCEKISGGDTCPLELEVIPASKPASVAAIKKKLDGEKLTSDEIKTIVKDIVDESLTDVEMTAFLTASHVHRLTVDEVEYLTKAMIDTGEVIEFDTHPVMDKHSIGGVPGNKISFLVVPIVAASGLLIPKTSSRAITGAGGTADLMEVLAPVDLDAREIKRITEKIGGVIAWGGATNIAPADDKLIRVEYPLSLDPHCQMLASVMAKKGAVSADNVVIDIPVGEGAKISDVAEGNKLGRVFIELGERLGMNVECALTYGSSPVGRTIGPVLEVKEALHMLETQEGPRSLWEKGTSIAGILLEMGGIAQRGYGKEYAEEVIRSGKALEKLKEIIEAQGGDPNVEAEGLEPGEYTVDMYAPADGYLVELKNKRLVEIARRAGAPNDHGAGLRLHKKRGQAVEKDDPVITVYADKEWKLENAVREYQRNPPLVVEGMLLERVPSDIHLQQG